MTMTDKPSPATERKPCPFCGINVPFVQDPNTKFIDSSWMEHPNNGCRIGRKMYVPEWNTRPLDLPSSCSSSHQEIRYTGEACPLCEAMVRVARKSVADWANAMCRDGHEAIAYVSVGEADCPLCFALWRINGPDGYEARDCDCYRTHDEYCTLSRPSEAPAPKEAGDV